MMTTTVLNPCISCPKENNFSNCKHRSFALSKFDYWKDLPDKFWDRNSFDFPSKIKRQRVLLESKKIDNLIQPTSPSLHEKECKTSHQQQQQTIEWLIQKPTSQNNTQSVAFQVPKPLQIITANADFKSNLHTYSQIVLKDMNRFGFCVIDNFLPNGDSVHTEVHDLYQKSVFKPGRVVNNKENTNLSTQQLVRSDEITWVEGNEPNCTNIGFLIQTLDTIVHRCNTTLATGDFSKVHINGRTKAMIACYPGNQSKYVRHIDNPNGDGRCITSIFYLNKNYDRKKHGGILRLYPQMDDKIIADIEPVFNRVVFFWSDKRNPHEVMPSEAMRFAITIWYLDNNQRRLN